MTEPRFTPAELASATGGRWIGPPPPELAGVSTDTRALAPGNLFVALRGEHHDAHGFLAEAAAKGAVAVVVAADWAAANAAPVPALAVPDTLGALGAVARLHRRRFKIPVLGVTGSNGKTTTREMIAAILGTRGNVLKTEGNLNNGVPLTLFRLDATHHAAVIEMGMNHAGEIARLAAIAEPHVGVVTNAGVAHIENLGSEDGIADAKAELYQGVPHGGLVVANADEARMLKRAQASGRRLLPFAAGRGRRGDVVVLDVLSQTVEGLRFVLGIGNREGEIRIPGLVGAHNARNAACAACAAIALGCSDKEIQEGLAAVRPVGRRLRLERLPSGVQLVDDCYNANPSSMAAALEVLHDLAAASSGGRALAALGDMLELGSFSEEAHRTLGADAARRGVAVLAAFGPRSRATADAARAAGLPEVFHTEDVEALQRFVRERLRPADVLLVKGSRGMKLERLVEALR
jgi:UDP-N-acetylmuramoyl-tripeptide--D-alanyl-D-alanine ligase